MYQQVLQCAAFLLQDSSEKNGRPWHNLFLTPYGANLAPTVTSIIAMLNCLPTSHVTSLLIQMHILKYVILCQQLRICNQPSRLYSPSDQNGIILEKPRHFRSNWHCLTCSHQNPENLTLNLFRAHAFIHGFLLLFVYTSGYATHVTSALDMIIALY